MRVIVIGGGLIGLSTAYALHRRGADVTVLEAREAVGRGSSFANGGMLTPSLPEPWNGPGAAADLLRSLFDSSSALSISLRSLPAMTGWGIRFLRNGSRSRHRAATIDNYQLARYSLEQTLRVREELKIDFDFSDMGTLAIFKSQRALDESLACRRVLEAHGIRVLPISAGEFAEREPSLQAVADSLAGGILLPDDRRGDAFRFCSGLAAAMLAEGVAIRCVANVSRVVVEKGKVRGVFTEDTVLAADCVVVAAGVHSPRLMRTAGQSLAVKPAKGYSITMDVCDGMKLPRHSVLAEERHIVVTASGSRLRVVGMADFDGFDPTINPARIRNLYRGLAALFPGLADAAITGNASEWAGFRPMSSDGRPFIGRSAIDGLFVNCGHGALGWTMAMGSGALLADVMFRKSPAIDPRPFAVDRRC